MYEVFEHTADLGLRIRAASRGELFVDAARGLFSLLVANLDAIEPVHSRTFVVEGDDISYQLFDWLNELLYAFESEKLLFSRFEVEFQAAGLRGTAWGDAMDTRRHQMENEVKAITYHQLRVEQSPDGWLAEVIVDI